jgi:hypothetical protein
MAETGIHVRAIMALYDMFDRLFAGRQDYYLAADMLWYWEEGNPDARVAPDLMYIPGVPRTPERRSFFTWREGGAVPAVVFEMASEGTWRDDLDDKFDLYERLGVREYFLFDPEARFLVPPLQGLRLRGTAYRRIRATGDTLASDFGFSLRAEGEVLRLIDSSGNPVLTGREEAEAERQRAEAERLRATGLESEVERLRALLKQYAQPNGNGP